MTNLGLVIGYGQAWTRCDGKNLHSTDGGATWHEATDECTAVWRRARMDCLSTQIADTPWWAFRKRRELRDDGVAFLNLGDSYASQSQGKTGTGEPYRKTTSGKLMPPQCRAPQAPSLKPKDLVGIPWRVALALQADGWWLRSDIVWAKPNPMPESVTDRPTKAHEYVFLLAKSARYFWDQEAVKEEAVGGTPGNITHKGKTAYEQGDEFMRTKVGLTEMGPVSKRNIRTVWTIATRPYSGAHFACVDSETEALTPLGWRKVNELHAMDTIVAYDKMRDCLTWSDAGIYRYSYDGAMVSIEKNETSQLLTPNHRVLVRRRKGHQGRNGWQMDIKRANELQPAYELLLSAPFPDDPLYTSESIGEDMAEIVGWYITEGYHRHNHQVGIDQSIVANPESVNRIRELLDNCGADYTERISERTWRGRAADMVCFIISGNIAAWLKTHAPGKEKRMTPALALLPMNEAEALWRGLIQGDGHTRKDGRSCFVQKDKATIDLVQMLAVRLGYKSVLSRRNDGVYVLYVTDKRWLTLRGTNGTHDPIPTKQYNGTVWCPHTDTGFWLARRDGKVFITGNTFPPDLVEPMIKAGSSPKGCCPNCGAPWERVVEMTKRWRDSAYDDEGRQSYRDGSDNRRVRPSCGGMSKSEYTTTGWTPTCECDADNPVPCIVLDPFCGSGTAGRVATKLRRQFIGLDVSHKYLDDLTRKRLRVTPMLPGME